MEMLISISLALVVITIGIKTFVYFSAEVKLSEARTVIDTAFVTINVNALTGKSEASDHYEEENTKAYQVSRYFLYFQKNEDWDEENFIMYGELQQGLRVDGENTRDIKDGFYELIYEEKESLPFSVSLADIYFGEGETFDQNIESLLVFFDPPFANVSFVLNPDTTIYQRVGTANSIYKQLSEIGKYDYRNEIYLQIDDGDVRKGKVEFALQYKDKVSDDENIDEKTQAKHNLLREYVEYDSKNQISHYWD